MTKLSTFDSVIAEMEQDPEFPEQMADSKPAVDMAVMIATLRLQLGLTQKEFARNAGVSQTYISSLESGASNPSIRALSRVLRKNGITLRMEATITAPPAAQVEPSALKAEHSEAPKKQRRLSA